MKNGQLSRIGSVENHEELFFWSNGAGIYSGNFPAWFDNSDSAVTRLLEGNYERIKAEVLEVYQQEDAFKPNWLPWGYSNTGWLTRDLYSYGMINQGNRRRFPVLDSVVRQIPGLMLTQISVLQPRTQIRPHMGETNGLVRCHLPLVVPGGPPELGMRIGHETRCWEEGKVWEFNHAIRHRAWNMSDEPRIVVVVDYIHPMFAHRQREVESNGLALMAMKGLAGRFSFLKRPPPYVTRPVQLFLSSAFRVLLWAQRAVGFDVAATIAWRPGGKRPSAHHDDAVNRSGEGATIQ